MADFNYYLNRQGVKGRKGDKGDTGYSPFISVAENTANVYKLRIQNENSEFVTDNLRGNAIEDTGGTYIRYNPVTGAMYTGYMDGATTTNAGAIRLTADGGLDNGGSDTDVPTSAQVYDFVTSQIGEAGLNFDDLSNAIVAGNNVTINIDSENETLTINASQPDLSGYQTKGNLVTSISGSSTDDKYPSAKCVYDAIQASTPVVPTNYITTDSSQTINLYSGSSPLNKTYKDSGYNTLVRDAGTRFKYSNDTGKTAIGENHYGGVKRGGIVTSDGCGALLGTSGTSNSCIFLPTDSANPLIIKGHYEPTSSAEVDAGYPIWNETVVSAGSGITITTNGSGRNKTYTLAANIDTSNFVKLTDNQTVDGWKTFLKAPTLKGVTESCLIFSNGNNNLRVADLIYTFSSDRFTIRSSNDMYLETSSSTINVDDILTTSSSILPTIGTGLNLANNTLSVNFDSTAGIAADGTTGALKVRVDGTTVDFDSSGNLTVVGGGATVDQTFDSTSANAQSGIAIAGELTSYALSTSVPTDTSDLTNGAGFITGITSGDVTTALGYTPYDSSNPNGYTSNAGTVTSVNNISPVNGDVSLSIPTDTSDLTNNAGFITGISSADVTTALGYTPYDSSNPSGYTTNVGTVTSVNNTQPDANGNVTIPTQVVNAGTGISLENNNVSIIQNDTATYSWDVNTFGNVSTTDGIYSNFSPSNRIQMKTIPSSFSKLEMNIRVTTGNSVSNWEAICGQATTAVNMTTPQIEIENGAMNVLLSANGSAWDTFLINNNIAANTTYDIHVLWDNNTASATLTNISTGTITNFTLNSGSTTISSVKWSTAMLIGVDATTNSYATWSGSIDSNYSYIKLDNQLHPDITKVTDNPVAKATTSLYGLVKPDGTSITINDGVISATQPQSEINDTTVSTSTAYSSSKSNSTYISSATVRNVVTLTQQQYDAIATPDPNTEYHITDAVSNADMNLSNLSTNGKIVIANNAAPSDKYDNLTLGASGTNYQAPANGWYFLDKKAGIASAYISMTNTANGLNATVHAPNADNYCRGYIPAAKSQTVNITYNASGAVANFRFIYAKGSESEWVDPNA